MLQQATFLPGFDVSADRSSSGTWRIYEGQTSPLLRNFLNPLTLAAANGNDTIGLRPGFQRLDPAETGNARHQLLPLPAVWAMGRQPAWNKALATLSGLHQQSCPQYAGITFRFELFLGKKAATYPPA